jgi:hypothetical protein
MELTGRYLSLLRIFSVTRHQRSYPLWCLRQKCRFGWLWRESQKADRCLGDIKRQVVNLSDKMITKVSEYVGKWRRRCVDGCWVLAGVRDFELDTPPNTRLGFQGLKLGRNSEAHICIPQWGAAIISASHNIIQWSRMSEVLFHIHYKTPPSLILVGDECSPCWCSCRGWSSDDLPLSIVVR